MTSKSSADKNVAPKISIIVPVYNVEKYLRRCLDSILAQTFTDFECICVDDGSPDGSGKILDEYAEKDSRFVVIHKDNGGVSSARNAGLDVARGEWITFVDSDDWVEAETYETAYSVAVENDADLIQWNSWIVNENGIKKPFYDRGKKGKKGYFSIEHCCTYFHGSMCNKIVSRKLFCSTKIRFDENISHCEDRIVAFKCYVQAEKCYQCEEFFYYYFQRSDSALHSMTRKKVAEEIEGIKIMESYAPEDVRKKLKKLFMSFKETCRSDAIFSFNPPDFLLFNDTFPEVKWSLLFHFRKASVIYWLVFLHMYPLASTIINLWRQRKKK